MIQKSLKNRRYFEINDKKWNKISTIVVTEIFK